MRNSEESPDLEINIMKPHDTIKFTKKAGEIQIQSTN